MQERALVLGGGGPAGIAWEVGLAAGLAAEGFESGRADSIIGTSAGSLVGAQLATGIDPQKLAEIHLAFAREAAKKSTNVPAPGINHLIEFMQRMPRELEPPASARAEMGTLALQSKTMPEATFLATFTRMFGPGAEWQERFSCCSVNALDGAFKRWTRADGVPLDRAVAASCSVPAIFPPIILQGSPWIDGGVRSWTNADCAAGHRRVVVFAVVIAETRELLLPPLARERAVIEAAGGSVEAIVPDATTLAVFGSNTMDAKRSAEIMNAGIAQGRREAARIKALWDAPSAGA